MGKGEGAKSTGYRAGTRDLFTKKFRSNGYNAPITTFMRNYKVGDVVDVVCDSRQQKGMPHKYYHGRTGRIWNVTKRAVGVEINKVHRQRQIVKRIHVRMEHLRPSKSAAGHVARIKSNEAIKKAAKLSGVPALASVLKRQPFGPRDGFELTLGNTCEAKVHTLTPVPYIFRPLERASDYSSRLA
jgi:large subunit ribosomal protein L21e|tara:strand:- start:201 stop:755 length:555 start_codon:yes stop_codon:yes gene_type:complete|eukprot:scaffold10026_cov62-Phaeocystis_antarctica.AAC.13